MSLYVDRTKKQEKKQEKKQTNGSVYRVAAQLKIFTIVPVMDPELRLLDLPSVLQSDTNYYYFHDRGTQVWQAGGCCSRPLFHLLFSWSQEYFRLTLQTLQ